MGYQEELYKLYMYECVDRGIKPWSYAFEKALELYDKYVDDCKFNGIVPDSFYGWFLADSVPVDPDLV